MLWARVGTAGHNVRVTSSEPNTATAPDEAAASIAAEPDHVLAAAVDVARSAAVDVGGDTVGEHLGVTADDEHVVTHAFATSLPGYAGWYWAVVLARAPEETDPTVDEVVLLPGSGALLAPPWVPWEDRLQPGDLSPGDLLPPPVDDPRLVPSYAGDEDEQAQQVAFELGLGRVHVMSREGRLDAAERWYLGDAGPDTAMARQAPAHCGTCGFLLLLEGSLKAGFGVCANEFTETDGRVVSVEFGCGAHSEVHVDLPPLIEQAGVVYDDGDDIEPAAAEESAPPDHD